MVALQRITSLEGEVSVYELKQKNTQLVITHLRLTCNFSLRYPYINQQTGNENTQTYQVEVFILI